MINQQLINPKNIAVVGASNNFQKPGGGLVKNLLDGRFGGTILPVNPKEKKIQGLKAYNKISDLPQTDLAVLAVKAEDCIESVDYLSKNKNTRAFIIISAGFSEMAGEGEVLENRLKELAQERNLSVIGPNCIGVINDNYKAVFVSPPPPIRVDGVDFVSASGALAVFLFENAALQGLKFSSVFTVGNSASIGVEEVLEFWDDNFNKVSSAKTKMVYVEQIRNSEKFFTHAHSLTKKGCNILVCKPGDSEAGARAALSHTGAMAGNTKAFKLLIEKAGGILCSSREELVNTALILQLPILEKKQVAVVTHAGGPGVLLTDHLQHASIDVPELDRESQKALLDILNIGASAVNPVDMLATANAKQLCDVLRICAHLDYIDGIIVIYGKTGMEDLFDTYKQLAATIREIDKPIYTVLPSVYSANEEIQEYLSQGLPVFFDEVVFARALEKVINSPKIFERNLFVPFSDSSNIQSKALNEEDTLERLKWSGIEHTLTEFVYCKEDLALCENLNFPMVAKVLGILHKTDVSGIVMNINSISELEAAWDNLSKIPQSRGIVVQEQAKGIELYLGAKMHDNIGYSVHAGLGGVFIDLYQDIVTRLAPISKNEAIDMLNKLKANKIFSGYRNMPQVDKYAFAEFIANFSLIFELYPDIREIDLNPLIANGETIFAVDARIIV